MGFKIRISDLKSARLNWLQKSKYHNGSFWGSWFWIFYQILNPFLIRAEVQKFQAQHLNFGNRVESDKKLVSKICSIFREFHYAVSNLKAQHGIDSNSIAHFTWFFKSAIRITLATVLDSISKGILILPNLNLKSWGLSRRPHQKCWNIQNQQSRKNSFRCLLNNSSLEIRKCVVRSQPLFLETEIFQ